VFVKPVRQGSSFGATLVEGPDGLAAAVADALAYDDRVLIEERLAGTELTVGVIGGDDDLVALPVIEIVTERTFFDYKAKYDPAASQEICPARVPEEVAKRAQAVALQAHRALGCADLSRTDMIHSGDRMVVLEVNTIPGMTANSLLPKSARVAGVPFGELLERLIRSALERGVR
jgi:D-alanine-D-alanine ligase